MKKLIFLVFAIVCCFSLSVDAQKKKTYIKNLSFTFNPSGTDWYQRNSEGSSWTKESGNLNPCHLEDDDCEMRATIVVNGNILSVMGVDARMEAKPQTTITGKLTKRVTANPQNTEILLTKDKSNKLYLGEFDSNEEFEIKFDIWEEDCKDEWSFNTDCWVNDDDQHEDTVTKANASKGHISYVKKAKGCVTASYTIVQE